MHWRDFQNNKQLRERAEIQTNNTRKYRNSQMENNKFATKKHS